MTLAEDECHEEEVELDGVQLLLLLLFVEVGAQVAVELALGEELEAGGSPALVVQMPPSTRF